METQFVPQYGAYCEDFVKGMASEVQNKAQYLTIDEGNTSGIPDRHDTGIHQTAQQLSQLKKKVEDLLDKAKMEGLIKR